MYQNQKRKRMAKFIRNKKAYERFQIDLVEFLREFIINREFKYLLTIFDYFSKYAWALLIKINLNNCLKFYR